MSVHCGDRLLLLVANEDDMFGWLARHPDRRPDCVVYRGKYMRLDGHRPFDRLAVSADAFGLDTAIAACLTRVKGPDGLTPGQRLCADEVGARMRGAS
jgi:hypothetical protein